MKQVEIFYTGTWSTTLEVPDDWELTHINVVELVADNEQDFDFNDGGAEWEVYSAGFETGPELVVD